MAILFLTYTIPVILLLSVLIYKPWRKNYVPVKTIASAAFVLLALWCGIHGEDQTLMRLELPAFVLCLCGDVFLGFYNGNRKKKYFIGGVFAFLMGHVFFLISFCSIQSMSWIDFLFPFLGTAVTVFLTNLERMCLGKLRPYVYLYSFFITMLFVKAVHVQMQMPDTGNLCRAIGTGLILISDFLILFLYFYKNRPWPTHGWNLAAYYYGMFFIAVGLLY